MQEYPQKWIFEEALKKLLFFYMDWLKSRSPSSQCEQIFCYVSQTHTQAGHFLWLARSMSAVWEQKALFCWKFSINRKLTEIVAIIHIDFPEPTF